MRYIVHVYISYNGLHTHPPSIHPQIPLLPGSALIDRPYRPARATAEDVREVLTNVLRMVLRLALPVGLTTFVLLCGVYVVCMLKPNLLSSLCEHTCTINEWVGILVDSFSCCFETSLMSKHLHACTRMHTHTHTHTYTHTHTHNTHTHIYTHTHIHTHTHIEGQYSDGKDPPYLPLLHTLCHTLSPRLKPTAACPQRDVRGTVLLLCQESYRHSV